MIISPHDAKVAADRVLEDFDDLCKILDIDYFWVAGTCLGFYRDGGYIPKDKDIDIGIFCNDEKFMLLVERLEGLGFVNIPQGGKPQWFIRDNILLDVCRIDIFARLRFFTPTFFKAFDVITYNGRIYKIPHPVEKYLEHCYGPGWKIPNYSKYDLFWERQVKSSD